MMLSVVIIIITIIIITIIIIIIFCQVTKNWWFGLVVWSWGQGLVFLFIFFVVFLMTFYH